MSFALTPTSALKGQAKVIASRVPPMQYPITLTLSLPVMSRMASLASSGPRCM